MIGQADRKFSSVRKKKLADEIGRLIISRQVQKRKLIRISKTFQELKKLEKNRAVECRCQGKIGLEGGEGAGGGSGGGFEVKKSGLDMWREAQSWRQYCVRIESNTLFLYEDHHNGGLSYANNQVKFMKVQRKPTSECKFPSRF